MDQLLKRIDTECHQLRVEMSKRQDVHDGEKQDIARLQVCVRKGESIDTGFYLAL